MKKLKKVLALLTTAAMLATTAVMPVFAADTAQLYDEPQPVTAELATAVEVVDEVELTTADEGIMTLSEAETSLPQASDGVITLENDVELAEMATISTDTTINLNGHSITRGSSNTTTTLIYVNSDVSLTVKDDSESGGGKIDSSGESLTGIAIQSYGTVTVESGEIIGTYGVIACSGSTAYIKGGTITATTIAVQNQGTLYVSDGTLSSSNLGISLVSGSDAVATVSGGTIKASGRAIEVNSGTAYITGGTIGEGSSYAVVAFGGTTTITGGTISNNSIGLYASGASTSMIVEGSSINVTNNENGNFAVVMWYGATVTINDGTISGGYAAVGVFGGDSENTTTLNVNGGTLEGATFGISTNGSASNGNCEINITGGTVSGGALGMYIPAVDSTTNISGGTITGEETGIEIRAGVLNVSGGTITSTYEGTAEISSNSSGTTVCGAGIAVSQHTTNQTVTVNITGGEISGYYGVCEANTVSGNTSAVTVTISGDTTVETTSDEGSAVYSSSLSAEGDTGNNYGTSHTTVAITSGEFNTDVSEYVASNHYQDDNGDVLLASTIVTDNDYYYLDGGSTVTITLDDLESKLKDMTWGTNDYGHETTDPVYDPTEVATIDVVLGEADADTVQSTYSDTITSKGSNDFAVDISVIKTYSDGTEEEISVTNQTVTINTPTNVSSVSGIYHISGGTATALTANTDYSYTGNTITLTVQSFSVYYFGLELASVAASDITSTVTLNLTEVTAGVPGTYYITLDAADGKTINRFMAAELAFELDDTLDITNIGAVSITPADYINVISSGNGEYEFNVKDTNGVVYGITGDSILLGTMTITGNGYFSLSLKTTNLETNTENQVQTAEVYNNIVSTYTLTDTTLAVGSTPLASGQITLPQTQITINVLFPNEVIAQLADYTDMTVTVSGLNVDKTISLGGNSLDLSSGDVVIEGADSTTTAYDTATGYQETVTVTTGYAYTLVFEGAGYRTFRTSVVPTSGTATVTVWNNAMDENMIVVSDTDDAMGGDNEKVTFLAGDIVADENINLYDLSAVVSYFGKENDTDYTSEFAKYDLNRDGKIDSKDIAMVLVSWDK